MKHNFAEWAESRFSVGVKFSALLIFTILATSTSLSVLFYIESVNKLEQGLSDKGTREAKILAYRATQHLINNDTWELYKAVKDTARPQSIIFNSVEYAAILDTEKRVAAHSSPKLFPIGSSLNIDGEMVRIKNAYSVISGASPENFSISNIVVPIIVREAKIGYAVVSVSDKILLQAVRALRMKILITTIILASISILTGYLLTRRLLGPLYVLRRRLETLPDNITRGLDIDKSKYKDEITHSASLINNIINRYKETTEELEIEKQMLDTILNGMQAGLIVVDRDLRIEWQNKIFTHWFGDKDDYPCLQIKGGGEICVDCPTRSALERNDIYSSKKEKRTRGGDQKIFNITSAPIHDSEGRTLSAFALYIDVTYLVDMEEESKKKEQLAALGEMAAGIAHEIRNPLSSLVTALKLILGGSMSASQEQKDKLLVIVEKETGRLNMILTDFLSYTQSKELNSSPMNINTLVEETLDLVNYEDACRTNVKIESVIKEDIPPVHIDSNAIKQVIWNLVINGIQSIDNGGSGLLAIETGCDDGSVFLKVRDNGKGMSEKDIQNCFTPFYSSKPGGTGLGMAISKRIIERHGARISVWSEVGVGTEFALEFPLNGKFAQSRYAEDGDAGKTIKNV